MQVKISNNKNVEYKDSVIIPSLRAINAIAIVRLRLEDNKKPAPNVSLQLKYFLSANVGITLTIYALITNKGNKINALWSVITVLKSNFAPVIIKKDGISNP